MKIDGIIERIRQGTDLPPPWREASDSSEADDPLRSLPMPPIFYNEQLLGQIDNAQKQFQEYVTQQFLKRIDHALAYYQALQTDALRSDAEIDQALAELPPVILGLNDTTARQLERARATIRNYVDLLRADQSEVLREMGLDEDVQRPQRAQVTNGTRPYFREDESFEAVSRNAKAAAKELINFDAFCVTLIAVLVTFEAVAAVLWSKWDLSPASYAERAYLIFWGVGPVFSVLALGTLIGKLKQNRLGRQFGTLIAEGRKLRERCDRIFRAAPRFHVNTVALRRLMDTDASIAEKQEAFKLTNTHLHDLKNWVDQLPTTGSPGAAVRDTDDMTLLDSLCRTDPINWLPIILGQFNWTDNALKLKVQKLVDEIPLTSRFLKGVEQVRLAGPDPAIFTERTIGESSR